MENLLVYDEQLFQANRLCLFKILSVPYQQFEYFQLLFKFIHALRFNILFKNFLSNVFQEIQFLIEQGKSSNILDILYQIIAAEQPFSKFLFILPQTNLIDIAQALYFLQAFKYPSNELEGIIFLDISQYNPQIESFYVILHSKTDENVHYLYPKLSTDIIDCLDSEMRFISTIIETDRNNPHTNPLSNLYGGDYSEFDMVFQ